MRSRPSIPNGTESALKLNRGDSDRPPSAGLSTGCRDWMDHKLEARGERAGHRWSVSGVNYDETFRNAVRVSRRCCLATVNPYEDQRARTVRALQQIQPPHVRFGSKADMTG
jgi:hypothetical protein